MKNKLLAVNTEKVANIGDYVQALASSQFLPSVDGFVERERLDEYDGEPCNVIMNGWYMHDAKHWPPSPAINPLFVAVHINSQVERVLLSEASIEYFKKHAPIGCRDERTRDLLISHGVDAYFSGCMTLTLGKKYKTEENDGQYYFVDVPLNAKRNLVNLLSLSNFFLGHVSDIMHIVRKFYPYDSKLKTLYNATIFYKEYSIIFEREILLDAHYICQQSKVYKQQYKSNEELLQRAENIVKAYAKAKLVVTARIHCALPCLALETPVLYVHNPTRGFENNCRLNGLLDLFNVIIWQDGHLVKPSFVKDKIDRNSQFKNKDSWRSIAKSISDICQNWCNQLK